MTKMAIFRDLIPNFSDMLHYKAMNRYFLERHYYNLTNIKVWVTSRQIGDKNASKTLKYHKFSLRGPQSGEWIEPHGVEYDGIGFACC